MDETANQIEAHIDRTRERLGSDLRELESRVDAATDWREHFRERPQLFLGAAFLGGALLAAALRSTPSADEPRDPGASARRFVDTNGSVHVQAWGLWNTLQDALFAVAASQLKDYIGEFIPGFDEHYRRAEQRAATDRSTGFGRTAV